jgi:hypothetical protein
MFVIIMFAVTSFDCIPIDWNKIVDIDDFFILHHKLNYLYYIFGSSAVMQTDGFEYLKESCPSVLTELLEYVARFTEHSDFMCKHRNEAILDGSDVNGRRVKQRL